jgi:hypothetical protein
MIKIPSPTSAYADHKVSLAGVTYSFVYRWNGVAAVWMLDIYLNNTPVILGQALLSQSALFYAKPIPNFTHGVLIVLPNTKTKERLGRDNLGINKLYTLYYFSNKELEEL